MIRFYVVPKIGDGQTMETPLRPAYVHDLGITHWQALDYGREPQMFVGADVTTAQHDALAASAGVTALPENIDATVPQNQVAQIRNALETIKMPGNWITAGQSYRQIAGHVAKYCLLLQRFDGLFASTPFDADITLDKPNAQVPPEKMARLRTAAESLMLDTSFITSTTTVREMFQAWIAQMPTIYVMGVAF